LKLHPLNYLNLVFWATILIVPFLLTELEVLNVLTLRTSKTNGWSSVFTGTFLHGNWSHLMGNFTSIILGTSVLLNFQKKMYLPVILLGLFIPPVFPLIFKPEISTIGISGLAYTLIWYIIFRGLMSRDVARFLFGIVFILFYGATAKGITPEVPFGISWLTHLGGFLVAFNLALFQRIKSDWLRSR
jgi:membrane associated rhomboid family serine protease